MKNFYLLNLALNFLVKLLNTDFSKTLFLQLIFHIHEPYLLNEGLKHCALECFCQAISHNFITGYVDNFDRIVEYLLTQPVVMDIHMMQPCLEDRDFGSDKMYDLFVITLDTYSGVIELYSEFFEQSADVD